ncbi:hypothetical protein BX600DRAFT_84449 [Xylariales sp. PMI_506]|nr:hypothetical protein BX600DRAFT_84449 [Xylariales sp. PMI_506]
MLTWGFPVTAGDLQMHWRKTELGSDEAGREWGDDRRLTAVVFRRRDGLQWGPFGMHGLVGFLVVPLNGGPVRHPSYSMASPPSAVLGFGRPLICLASPINQINQPTRPLHLFSPRPDCSAFACQLHSCVAVLLVVQHIGLLFQPPKKADRACVSRAGRIRT